MLGKYNVWDNPLHQVPTPVHGRPLPFLPVETAWRCTFGGPEPCNIIFRDAGDHYRTYHKGHTREKRMDEISVQSFSRPPRSRPRNDFEVHPHTGVGPDPHAPLLLRPNTDPEALSRAFRTAWTPLPTAVGTVGDGYKESSPFLVQSGLSNFIEGWDEAKLTQMLALIEEPGGEDDLRLIVDQAEKLFKEQQAVLHHGAKSHKLLIMADDADPKALERLDTDSSQNLYGRCWGLFLVMLTRLYCRKEQGLPDLGIVLTTEQYNSAKRLWRQVSEPAYHRSWPHLLLGVSYWMWQGESEDDFKHLVNNKWTDPTLVYCVLLALRPGGGFEDPKECGHKWAPVKYMIRNAILHYHWGRYNDEQIRITNSLTVSQIATELTRGVKRDQLYPFGAVAELSSVAYKYADTTTKPPMVIWTESDELTVAGSTRVKIPRWRSGVGNFVEDTLKFWKDEIFLGIPTTSMGLLIDENTELYDDPSATRPGYSFLNDPRNKLSNLRCAFADAIFHNPAGQGMHHGLSGNTILWDPRAIDTWLEKLKEGNLRFMSCVHLACGLPPRGTEESGWTVVNRVGRPRNIITLGKGQIAFIDMYNKTSRLTGYDKPRAHFLPWRLAQVFLAMHALAIPFASFMIQRESGPAARILQETLAFPLRGTGPDTHMLSGEINRVFLTYVGSEGMTIRNYRHFSDAVTEAYAPTLKDPTASLTGIGDNQMGHGGRTAAVIYGTAPGRTQILHPQDLLRYRAASLLWASFVMPPEHFTATELRAIAYARGEPTIPTLFPPSSTGNINPQELAKLVADQMDLRELGKHIAAEQLQHSQQPPLPSERPPEQPITGLSVNALMTRPSILTPVQTELSTVPLVTRKHKSILRIFTGDVNAQWTCPGQAHAFVLATERNRQSLLVILPTGSGKSFLFMGLPLKERGITVVVFPLVALLEDQMRTAEKLRITVTRWGLANPVLDPPDGLVFVSVEHVDALFLAWLLQLREIKRLARIVFDEGHIILEGLSYRKALTNMKRLIEAGVPLLVLTATLPPILESELIKELGDPTIRIIREGTQRPNIEYYIIKYANSNLATAALIMHAKAFQQQLRPGEGILICCRTHKHVEDLSALIPGSLPYHSQLEERLENAAAWLEGKAPILVGTSGVGTGVNHPACRAVLHENLAWGLNPYGQETGRCGRDGKRAVAITFHAGPKEAMPPKEKVYNGWETMVTLAGTSDCIRGIMSNYLDGPDRQVSCYSGPYIECGNCQAQSIENTAPEPQKDWPVDTLVTSLVDDPTVMEVDDDPQIIENLRYEAMQMAIEEAEPAATPHPTVMVDAQRAVTRRVEALNDRIRAGKDGDMNVELLMMVKRWMENRCILCMVKRFDNSGGHMAWKCPHNPGVSEALDGHTLDGKKMGYYRYKADLPSGHSVCYFCHWPKKGYHDGPAEKGNHPFGPL
ncbi:hypothetical protein FRC11_006208 [Ceratobasidium sp. 423]|nr:hypothetical protein FRC11_006208 [Ceratobasidium sp. 423]